MLEVVHIPRHQGHIVFQRCGGDDGISEIHFLLLTQADGTQGGLVIKRQLRQQFE